MDPLITAGLIALIGTLAASFVGGVTYLWRRDPAGARNGVLTGVSTAMLEMAHVTERMNSAHAEYLLMMKEQDRRNREEHQALLRAIERLTDLVAPRKGAGL